MRQKGKTMATRQPKRRRAEQAETLYLPEDAPAGRVYQYKNRPSRAVTFETDVLYITVLLGSIALVGLVAVIEWSLWSVGIAAAVAFAIALWRIIIYYDRPRDDIDIKETQLASGSRAVVAGGRTLVAVSRNGKSAGSLTISSAQTVSGQAGSHTFTGHAIDLMRQWLESGDRMARRETSGVGFGWNEFGINGREYSVAVASMREMGLLDQQRPPQWTRLGERWLGIND